MKTKEFKFPELEEYCIANGLTLREYQVLTCTFDGQMTDAEIRAALFLTKPELDELVEGLRAKSLIGRRKGRLIASIEGRSAYHHVPPLAA